MSEDRPVTGPPSSMGWHVICGEDFLAALKRCAAGEDPDAVYIELYVNADRERPQR